MQICPIAARTHLFAAINSSTASLSRLLGLSGWLNDAYLPGIWPNMGFGAFPGCGPTERPSMGMVDFWKFFQEKIPEAFSGKMKGGAPINFLI